MSDAIIGSSSMKGTLNKNVAAASWSSSPSIGRRDKLSAFACHLVPLYSML